MRSMYIVGPAWIVGFRYCSRGRSQTLSGNTGSHLSGVTLSGYTLDTGPAKVGLRYCSLGLSQMGCSVSRYHLSTLGASAHLGLMGPLKLGARYCSLGLSQTGHSVSLYQLRSSVGRTLRGPQE